MWKIRLTISWMLIWKSACVSVSLKEKILRSVCVSLYGAIQPFLSNCKGIERQRECMCTKNENYVQKACIHEKTNLLMKQHTNSISFIYDWYESSCDDIDITSQHKLLSDFLLYFQLFFFHFKKYCMGFYFFS